MPEHAPLAVGWARSNQRFWRYAGPIGLVTFLVLAVVVGEFRPVGDVGDDVAVGLFVVGGVLSPLIARFFFSRARRAEARNLEIMEGRPQPRRQLGVGRVT